MSTMPRTPAQAQMGFRRQVAVASHAHPGRHHTSPAEAHVLSISIDRGSSAPMYRQIYGWIRDAIHDGRLPRGARLPATRSLATQLSVSRKTVLAAFELLVAEELVDGQVGAGTWVFNRPDPHSRDAGPG